MPRINPVHDRDKAIGKRLRELRNSHMAKRTAVALRLGISTDQLASYEFGRVPLSWSVGERICKLFNVSQAWLATGEGERDHYYPFQLKPHSDGSPVIGKFGQIFDEHFAPELKLWQTTTFNELAGPNGHFTKINKSIKALMKHPKSKVPKAQIAWIAEQFEEIKKSIAAAEKEMGRRPRFD